MPHHRLSTTHHSSHTHRVTDAPVTEAHKLNALGQSVWLDSISRDMLSSGELRRMVSDLGVVGVTSNPTIFAQALAAGEAYDEQIGQAIAAGAQSDRDVFEQLAVRDIREACEQLVGVHERSGGIDGMVSMEVEPDLADDTEASLARARELWAAVDRPNLMVKVPATDAGLPVIEQLIFEGINVNVTLLFSVDVYRTVIERYIRGLERRLEASLPLEVASVASFFVSRVDTAVDRELDVRGSAGEALKGRVAVANAQLAWDAYLSVFTAERFMRLKAQGALPQRPLWASTGTKNADYSDILYVQELIVPGTVNTMPLKTLEAFIDHGDARVTITDTASAYSIAGELNELGINLRAITEQLRTDGVHAFATSYDELLDGLAAKREQLTQPPS